MDLVEHLIQQQNFSIKTFGPGTRLNGVCDHIRKELIELGSDPDDLEQALLDHLDEYAFPMPVTRILRDRAVVRAVADPGDPKEWVDAVLLSLDGLWRSLRDRYSEITDAELAFMACELIDGKQTKNEGRDWPDWRTMPADKAIEHDRTGETSDV